MSALLAQEIEKRAHPEIRLIADAGVASLRLSSYRMLLSLRDLSTAELQNQNTVQAHLLAAAGGAGLKPEQNSYKELFTRLANRGSLAGVESLRGKAVRKDIASTMTFDLINPRVLEFINRYTLSLITLISADTRTAIQAILYNAVRSGMPPREQARLIRPLIGLTTNQVSAVTRYRAALEAGQYRQTLNNVLRDKRYDASTLRALRNKDALSRAQIDKMVARYAERQLKHRAEMIARTETIRAANAGQVESWMQAQEQGLTGTMRERWLVASDERLCPNCQEIPRMNPDGVAIGGMFATPYGPIMHPPAHPMCRCSLGIR
jgi:hypothetical protein